MWEKLDSEWFLRLNVIDQAVGNYIIYHDKIFDNCLIKSENKDGPVMTLGLYDKAKIFFDLDDNIVNGEGKVAAVIHQYDRIPQIVQKVINKYCPEINITKINDNEINYKTSYYYINIFFSFYYYYFFIYIIFINNLFIIFNLMIFFLV